MDTSEKQGGSQPWTSCNAILIHMLPCSSMCTYLTHHATSTSQPDSSCKHSEANLPNFKVSLVKLAWLFLFIKILCNRFLISAFPTTNLFHGLCTSPVREFLCSQYLHMKTNTTFFHISKVYPQNIPPNCQHSHSSSPDSCNNACLYTTFFYLRIYHRHR